MSTGLNSGLSQGMQELLAALAMQETVARSRLGVAIARANIGQAVSIDEVRRDLTLLDWHPRELAAFALRMQGDPRDEHAGPSPIVMSLRPANPALTPQEADQVVDQQMQAAGRG